MTPPALFAFAAFAARSIAIRYRRCSFRLLNAGPRVGFVISHDSLPQNPIEQIGIDEVGVFEVKAFGRLRPPRTVVERFDRGSYRPVSGIVTFRYQGRVHRRLAQD